MDLTLAIITKNRLLNLKKCLASIVQQTNKNFIILIVDNDTAPTAKPVVDYFRNEEKITIRYLFTPCSGYSQARNCALDHCDTAFLGFVDDDCVLTADWVEQGLAGIYKYDSCYVVGSSRARGTTSLYIQVEKWITANWWSKSYNTHTMEVNPVNLDTKNIILNRNVLLQHRISFDDRFNVYVGEDTDLGLQLKYNGLKGYFIPEMVLVHEEADNFQRFKRKGFAYGYNSYGMYTKWSPLGECLDWHYHAPYWFISGWHKLFTFKQGTVFKNLYFFYLFKLFNFCYLRGVAKSKKQWNPRSQQSVSKITVSTSREQTNPL